MQACPGGRAHDRSSGLTVVEVIGAALGNFFSPQETWCIIN